METALIWILAALSPPGVLFIWLAGFTIVTPGVGTYSAIRRLGGME